MVGSDFFIRSVTFLLLLSIMNSKALLCKIKRTMQLLLYRSIEDTLKLLEFQFEEDNLSTEKNRVNDTTYLLD